jgi:sugar phosphate isomerase/epimerase
VVNTVTEGLELLTEVDAANLGMLLDTFHMNIEEPALEASIRRASERMFHVHVADSNRWHPGAGHIDFKRVVDVLQKIRYAGFISAEILPLPDADTAAALTVKCLRPLVG